MLKYIYAYIIKHYWWWWWWWWWWRQWGWWWRRQWWWLMITIFWYSFLQNGDTFYSKNGYILNWFMITQFLNSASLSLKSCKWRKVIQGVHTSLLVSWTTALTEGSWNFVEHEVSWWGYLSFITVSHKTFPKIWYKITYITIGVAYLIFGSKCS